LETIVLACEKPESVAARADRMLADGDKLENPESKAVLYSNGERSITVLSALSNDNADKPFLNPESNLGSSTSSEQNDQMHTIVLDDAVADHHIAHGHSHHNPSADAPHHGGHGHSHAPVGHWNIRSLALMMGLSVHSFLEGIAVGIQVKKDEFWSMIFAVMLHEVLCALAFGITLAQQTRVTGRLSLATVFSAVMVAITIPLGMCVGWVMPKTETETALYARFVLEGIAAGTFVYVSCMEMLAPEIVGAHSCGSHRCWPLIQMLSVCAGAILFVVIQMFSSEH